MSAFARDSMRSGGAVRYRRARDWYLVAVNRELRGCGFFKVVDDKIVFQRGYFDELSFLRQQGLPLPTD